VVSAVQSLRAELMKLSREHDVLKRQFELERQDSMKMRKVLAKLNL